MNGWNYDSPDHHVFPILLTLGSARCGIEISKRFDSVREENDNDQDLSQYASGRRHTIKKIPWHEHDTVNWAGNCICRLLSMHKLYAECVGHDASVSGAICVGNRKSISLTRRLGNKFPINIRPSSSYTPRCWLFPLFSFLSFDSREIIIRWHWKPRCGAIKKRSKRNP